MVSHILCVFYHGSQEEYTGICHRRRRFSPKTLGRLRYEKNSLRLGDLHHLHPAAVCHHGYGIQWVFRVPALHHEGKGAHQCPDLLPGHPAVRGVLSVHAGHRFYYQKVSIRVGTTIAAAAAGVSFLLYSAAEAYPLFCVGAAISGVSYGLGSMIPVSILINRWFYQHRALALSICASGSGIATIVLPPVTTAPGGEPVHGHHLPDRGRGHLSPGSGDLPGPAEPAGGQRPAPLRPDPGPGGCGPGPLSTWAPSG